MFPSLQWIQKIIGNGAVIWNGFWRQLYVLDCVCMVVRAEGREICFLLLLIVFVFLPVCILLANIEYWHLLHFVCVGDSVSPFTAPPINLHLKNTHFTPSLYSRWVSVVTPFVKHREKMTWMRRMPCILVVPLVHNDDARSDFGKAMFELWCAFHFKYMNGFGLRHIYVPLYYIHIIQWSAWTGRCLHFVITNHTDWNNNGVRQMW